MKAGLDVVDNDAREMSALRVQRAKMNLQHEQHMQAQELKDINTDARQRNLSYANNGMHKLQQESAEPAISVV